MLTDLGDRLRFVRLRVDGSVAHQLGSIWHRRHDRLDSFGGLGCCRGVECCSYAIGLQLLGVQVVDKVITSEEFHNWSPRPPVELKLRTGDISEDHAHAEDTRNRAHMCRSGALAAMGVIARDLVICVGRFRHSSGCQGMSLASQATSEDETSRTGVRIISVQGVDDVSYSTTSYVRPHVSQLEQGALFGGWSHGIEALLRSSRTASSNVSNDGLWGSACLSSSMTHLGLLVGLVGMTPTLGAPRIADLRGFADGVAVSGIG